MPFLDDLDAIDPTASDQTGPQYVVAQWLHGDPKLAAAGGVTHTGGVIIPSKYIDDTLTAPGWGRTDIAFSSGKTEQALAAMRVGLAVIRTRFRWFVVYNGVTTYFPRSGYQADSGFRGHLQVLCGVRGFNFPLVVTFKGKASQEFEKMLAEFNQKVVEAANKLRADKAKPKFPRYAFWMKIGPGPHVKVGQKGQESIITPPVLDVPNVVGEDYLSKLYVGRELLLTMQDEYRNAAEWATAWDKGATEAEEYQGEPEGEPRQPVMQAPSQSASQALGVAAHFGAGAPKQPPPPDIPDDPNW
jgi:hypothetical protein